MSVRLRSSRLTTMPCRFAVRRAASLLILSATLSGFLGCASYETYTKTAGNNTSEIDALTADAENPIPEVYQAAYSSAPITSKSLRDGQEIQYRDVSVGEVLRIALEHSEVLRELGGTILRTPESIRTRYTAGLQQTDPRFGTHAALSAFDAQFKGSAMINNNDRIYNNSFFAGGINSYLQNLDEYKAELSKRAATGALLVFRNVTESDRNNAPGNLFIGAWSHYTEGEARQPLLQGGGLQFNRIAGPGSAPGLYNGILIARVNTDITQTDFEISVRDYVSNVVNLYWDLYYSYRDLDARRRAMHAALESWRKVKAQVEAEGLSASKEAQAREQYYRFKQEVDDSLSGRLLQGTQSRNGSTGGTLRANGGVQVNERRLRLMIGLPITDGTLLRPSQEPDEAEVVYDWEILMQESLARRPELRRQQLKVKRREMELLAAQNFIIPQLDAVGRYRFRGFGDKLIQHSGNQGGGKPASALGNLATFEHQEWMLGLEFSMPIGFRQGHAAVANAELALCHERAIHREQEREVVHDLSNALSDAVRAYESCQSSLNRYIASREVMLSLEAEEKNGLPIDIDRILDTQRRVVEAEIRYYQSRTEYAVSQKNVQLERGALAGENDLWIIDGVDSSASGYQPMTLPNRVPPAPEPAVNDEMPTPQTEGANRIPDVNSTVEPGSVTERSAGSTPAEKMALAKSLMRQARQDLARGDVTAAREKAEQAVGVDVAYSVFDERPEQLLTEIDRRANNSGEETLDAPGLAQSHKPTKPAATTKTQAVSPFAEEVPTDEDVPETKQLAETAKLPSSVNNDKQTAQRLLKQAQIAASNGELEHARLLALKANELNVAYDLFELRPEQVLAQVDRDSHNQTTAKAMTAAKELDSASPASATKRSADSTSVDKMTMAKSLMRQARHDLEKGDLASARDKTEQAADIDVAYSVFDEHPEQLLTEIDRQENDGANGKPSTRNLAKTPMSDNQAALDVPTTNSVDKMTMAKSLMQQARHDLEKGDLAAARDKAEQAAGIDVAYSVFDERPEQLLTEIDRRADNGDKDMPRAQSLTQTRKPTMLAATKSTGLPSSVNNDKQRAQHLLKQAQIAANNGDLEQARSLALEANDLNVSYEVLELRPEQVLAQIDRASNKKRIVKGNLKGNLKAKPSPKVSLHSAPPADKPKTAVKQFPATKKVRPTSAKIDMVPTLELDDSPNEPRDNGVISVPSAPDLDEAMPVPPEPAVDEASAMPPPRRNFGNALLVPSASDDDDEVTDEFWDK